jgi:hypothetical protein
MTIQQKITDYELIDHGVDGEQYFPGCGVAYTLYSHIATGCGENFAEAIEDALEQIGEANIDAENLEARIKAAEGIESWPTSPSAQEVFEKWNPGVTDDDSSGHELHYYVSIRYNIAEQS